MIFTIVQMKNRIIELSKRIKKNSVIADIGSDHAFLSIYLLKNKIAKFVYNIDINSQPLNNGINNLKKTNFFSFTKNIQGDGLKNFNETDYLDYVVISGLGDKTIIDIIDNFPKKLVIKNLLLCSNNLGYELRKFLIKKKWKFIDEDIIYDKSYYYSLMILSKDEGIKYRSYKDLYFGKINLKQLKLNFKLVYKNRYDHIKMNHLDKYNKKIEKEYKLLNAQEWINS